MHYQYLDSLRSYIPITCTMKMRMHNYWASLVLCKKLLYARETRRILCVRWRRHLETKPDMGEPRRHNFKTRTRIFLTLNDVGLGIGLTGESGCVSREKCSIQLSGQLEIALNDNPHIIKPSPYSNILLGMIKMTQSVAVLIHMRHFYYLMHQSFNSSYTWISRFFENYLR